MSLALALEQIQKPTWYGDKSCAKGYGGGFKQLPQVAARRETVLAHLESTTARITTDDLIEVTGATRSQVQKTMSDLFNDGLVEKGTVKIGGNKCSTWRLVDLGLKNAG